MSKRVRCMDCGAESFASVDVLCAVCRGKLRKRIAALEAEVERLQIKNTQLRDAIRSVYTRVQHIKTRGRIAVPAALWIMEKLHAALVLKGDEE